MDVEIAGPDRSGAMSSAMRLIEVYPCPRCRAELEARFHEWQGWQRCPKCGLPSLPPEPTRPIDLERQSADLTEGSDILFISDTSEHPDQVETLTDPPVSRASHVSAARLIFRTGLLVSAGLAFVFFLDRLTTHTLIFAALAVVFFILLIRKPVKRSTWY
jgi:hypothetical protein